MTAAAHANTASVLLHDSMRQPQAEASSNVAFGGVERLEDMRQVFGRDAGTGISHYHPHAGASFGRVLQALINPDAQPASLIHGFDRIVDQVRKQLPQLTAVTAHQDAGSKFALYANGGNPKARRIGLQGLL